MIWEIILLVVAVPVGYLLAWLCKEELVEGRKWFRVLFVVFVILSVWFFLIGQKVMALTSVFIVIVAIVNYVLSSDKKFVKK